MRAMCPSDQSGKTRRRMGADQSVTAMCCAPRAAENGEQVANGGNQHAGRKGNSSAAATRAAPPVLPPQNGEETIARRTAEPASCGLLFYSSWFCPYAQRAWAVLEELSDRNVKYRFIPVNPYEVGSDERVRSVEDMKFMYDVFVEASPNARVPALNHNGVLVNDFTGGPTCAEYLSDHFSVLKPATQADRAKVEEFWKLVDAQIAEPFKEALAASDAQEQTRAYESLLAGLRQANKMMESQSDSGFFFGENEFSLADIALAPFFQRCESVLKHHRGREVPRTEDFGRLHKWWGAVSARPSFKRTLLAPQRLTSLPASGTFAWTRVA